MSTPKADVSRLIDGQLAIDSFFSKPKGAGRPKGKRRAGSGNRRKPKKITAANTANTVKITAAEAIANEQKALPKAKRDCLQGRQPGSKEHAASHPRLEQSEWTLATWHVPERLLQEVSYNLWYQAVNNDAVPEKD
jgi:hypothetical protein